jgi:hypothetical protein
MDLFPHSHTTDEWFAKTLHVEKKPYRTLDDFQFPISASQMKHLPCQRPQYYKYMALVSQRSEEMKVVYLFLCILFVAAVAKI